MATDTTHEYSLAIDDEGYTLDNYLDDMEEFGEEYFDEDENYQEEEDSYGFPEDHNDDLYDPMDRP